MPPGAASAFFDVQIIGDDHGVQHMLKVLDTAMSAPAIGAMLTQQIEPFIKERAAKRFAGEGDDAVGKWAPLSSETERIRSSQGFSPAHPINVRTTELENYIVRGTGSVNIFSEGATLQYPKPSGKLSIREKMATAQKGRAKPRTVPRPVLGLSHTDLEFVLLTLAYHVKGTARTVTP